MKLPTERRKGEILVIATPRRARCEVLWYVRKREPQEAPTAPTPPAAPAIDGNAIMSGFWDGFGLPRATEPSGTERVRELIAYLEALKGGLR